MNKDTVRNLPWSKIRFAIMGLVALSAVFFYFNRSFVNKYVVYFLVGGVLFALLSATRDASGILIDYAGEDIDILRNYMRDLIAGSAGGFVVSILTEIEQESIFSLSYWMSLPVYIFVLAIFIVVLGIPYISFSKDSKKRANNREGYAG